MIFHHRVIKTDYFLQSSIETIALDYLKDPKEEVEEPNNSLPFDISGLWKAIAEQCSGIEFSYALMQWDDAWLLTVLKTEYFKNYVKSKEKSALRLNELLTNKKYYYSIVKKNEQFSQIDKSFADYLFSKKEEIYDKISYANSVLILDDHHSDFKALTKQIEEQLKKAETYLEKNSFIEIDGFLLSHVYRIIYRSDSEDSGPLGGATFDACLNNSLNDVLKNNKRDISDICYVKKTRSIGTNKPLFLYIEENKEIQTKQFVKVSNIPAMLGYDMKFLPTFYVYVLLHHREEPEKFDFSELRQQIGTAIGQHFINDVYAEIDKIVKTVT